MVYPYSFGIMIKEIFQATIFYTIDHYHRMDKNMVFEGRVVFGGHIPVLKQRCHLLEVKLGLMIASV